MTKTEILDGQVSIWSEDTDNEKAEELDKELTMWVELYIDPI